MQGKLTVHALVAVLAFGLLGIFQILNILLAIPAVAGLIMLLTDRRWPLGLAAAAGCLGLAFSIGGEYLLMETIILVILPSAIITLCIKANKEPAFAIVMVLVPILILIIIFFASVGESGAYFERIRPTLENDFREMAGKVGLGAGSVQSVDEYIELSMKTMKYMIRFLPAIIMTIFTALAALAYKLAEYGFKQEGKYLIPFPAFRHWKIKDNVLIIFGIGLMMVILGGGIIRNIGENTALYTFVLFSFGGLSLVEALLQKQKASGLLKFLVYLSIVILNIYGAVVLGTMGLIDSHFDFRRLRAIRIG
jgi:hypothetical protein